ncbi:probable E3 ubiquitin-protein ligase ARI2 [Hordeum vulgare subsp. vulgare]|uniref:probable E3 ubiquitin-protein ligase ARI2 n=1 Tax=Hordeum vulgare subsp. vulgare TaxID=112509 RepID=UPI001D1A4750|nr:probable E3 ubiquitin-protein ligase ARI2 [Hordeum vulgare subsp. vulgare]
MYPIISSFPLCYKDTSAPLILPPTASPPSPSPSWLCGGATGRDHTWSSISGHSCGRFTEDQSTRTEQARRDLYRYMHYHNRYKAHTDSLKQEEKLKRDIQWKISISENKDSKIKDYSWVINGLNRLFRSRRVLSYSYPFAFYMFGDEIFKDEMTPEERELKQNLFEDQQQQLEFNVDRLSGFLEKDFQNFSDEEVMDTMKHVINLSNVVDRLCKQMYQCIDNDLLYPLCMPHNIAPYKSKGLDRASELHISLDSAEQSSPSMKCRQDEDKSQPGLCSESGSSLTGNRPILQLHGASSDNNGRRSHKRERRDAYGGGALFDLNVPAEVADKI